MDKNIETALRYLKDPSYIPFLQKLKKAAVTTLVPLSAFCYPSKEPIPFAQARTLPYIPARKGDPWGGMFECAWFRFTGKAPITGREDLALVLDVGGEGCVYDRTGVVQGITKVLGAVDFLQILPGKQMVPLDRLALEGETVEIWVDCGNNGFSGDNIAHVNEVLANSPATDFLFATAPEFEAYRFGMFFLISVPTAISCVIAVLPMLKYELTNAKHAEILAQLNERRNANG